MNIELRYPTLKDKNEVTVNRTEKKSFPFSNVILIFIASLLAFSVVTFTLKADEASAQLDEISAELKALDDEQKLLQEQIDGKISADEAIKIAQEEYGMVKAESLPQMYVSVPTEDKSEVLRADEEKNTLLTLFSAIGESLSAILEYMQG